MTRFNLQSLLFALVLLILVLIGKSEGADTSPSPVTNNIVSTSLIAEVDNLSPKYEFAEGELSDVVPPPRVQSLSLPPTPPPPPPSPSQPVVRARNTEPLSSSAFEAKIRFFTSLEPETQKPLSKAPKISSKAALVKELTHENIMLEKNLSQRWPLASITKLMTALVALDRFEPDDKVKVSERAVATEGQAGNFRAGEVFTVLDLVKALLIVSSNDAATALGEHIGTQKFLELMRSRAFDLGLNQTTFIDSPGLSVLSQSTLSDLGKLSVYILEQRPNIFEISALREASITNLTSGTARLLRSNNKFAGAPDFIGGKTGYTDEAQGNLLSIFRYKDYAFLIIVFGSQDRIHDTEKLYTWAKSNF